MTKKEAPLRSLFPSDDTPIRRALGESSLTDIMRAPWSGGPTNWGARSLGRSAFLLELELGEVFFYLALDALQRVIDRFHVASEIARHLLIALAFEIRLEDLRLEL